MNRAADRVWRGLAIAMLPLLACVDPTHEPEDAELLGDDPLAYLSDAGYRRAILERDLVSDAPIYAQVRLRYYAQLGPEGEPDGWDALPVVDWASAPLTLELAAQLAASQTLPAIAYEPPLSAAFDGPEQDLGERLPQTQAEWAALGEQVFFAYPMSVAPSLAAAVRAGVDLRDYGILVHDGAYVGVRVFDAGDPSSEASSEARIAITCASCHASIGPDGRPSGVRANREYDFGRLRVDFGGGAPEAHAVDATAFEDLAALGPGRSDVQNDGVFNPYAFPDFGGIADLPYLHHTANWHNRGVASLAIRIETVFVSGTDRPPRVLTWALAEYLRSLPAPAPVDEASAASERGAAVFEAQGCAGCHTPPLYTSDTLVSVAELGTDDAAGTSPVRATGFWRVPSLRGVGGNGPYLHHGAFETLEAMFEPERAEPGHRFGLGLEPSERADLLAFLRTI